MTKFNFDSHVLVNNSQDKILRRYAHWKPCCAYVGTYNEVTNRFFAMFSKSPKIFEHNFFLDNLNCHSNLLLTCLLTLTVFTRAVTYYIATYIKLNSYLFLSQDRHLFLNELYLFYGLKFCDEGNSILIR